MKYSTVPINKKKDDCVHIDARHKYGGKRMALKGGKGNGRRGMGQIRRDRTKRDGGRKVEISILQSASVATTETTVLTQLEPRK